MKNINTRLGLVILAVLSLISGIPINGVWSLAYQFTFMSGPEMIFIAIKNHSINVIFIILWLSIFLSNIAILFFPFIPYRRINVNKCILYIPLVFLIGQFLIWSFFSFVLLPFIAVWLSLLFYHYIYLRND